METKSKIGKDDTCRGNASILHTRTCSVLSNRTSSHCTCNRMEDRIVFGRIQFYDEKEKNFSDWDQLIQCRNCEQDTKDSKVVVNLHRGGQVTFYPSIIGKSDKDDVSAFMDNCDFFRQYRINGFREPRIHVLLSSTANCGKEDNVAQVGPGYAYHGVRMKALPLQKAPPVEKIASMLGSKFQLEKNTWSIGVDLVIYRDGKDKMGFHADDTQKESLILTVVIESDDKRVIKIRPKKGKKEEYVDGDEQIELFIKGGDGYRMNGMCHHYII